MRRLRCALVVAILAGPACAPIQTRSDAEVCARGMDLAFPGVGKTADTDYELMAACNRLAENRQLPLEDRIVALRKRGLAWFVRDDGKRALADFDEAIRLNPGNAPSFRARAVARGFLDEPKDRLLADCEEAIRLDPRDAANFLCRAALLDDERAMRDYDEAVRLAPQFALARVNRAGQLKQMGEIDRAFADLDEAIRLEPAQAHAYRARADLWQYQKRDRRRALADLDVVVRLEPDNSSNYFIRALYRGDDEDAAAIDDYSAAIRLNPNSAIYHLERGKRQANAGKTALARADFEAAGRLASKDNANGLNEVAWRLATSRDAALRNGNQAVQFAQRACELTAWKEPNYIDTLAAAYAEIGWFTHAVRWQEQALGFAQFEKASGPAARERLALYRDGKPYRE